MATLSNSWLQQRKFFVGLWLAIILAVVLKANFFSAPSNNYQIFKYTFFHALEEKSLYGRYPAEYGDKNHYGPLFSLVIAPFAVLPDWLGLSLWVAGLTLLLLWAVLQLPLKSWQRHAIMLISANELLTAGFNAQFNIAVAALVILSYTLIVKEKEWLAPLPFLIATFVKLYGIVALAFFFFVKDKPRYVLACVGWSAVLFLLPMALSSPDYVWHSYQEWFYYLMVKNNENISLTSYQDISIMGFFRRLFQNAKLPNLPFLIAGAIMFALPYLRVPQYKARAFQLLMVASTLMFPVIFSSSSEGSTYIIVFMGIAIWFVIQPKPYQRYHWVLLAIAFLFASFNSTDLYPKFLRELLRLHAVKALACTVVWLRVTYELMTKDFRSYDAHVK
jgi:hypothetical protein